MNRISLSHFDGFGRIPRFSFEGNENNQEDFKNFCCFHAVSRIENISIPQEMVSPEIADD